MKKLMVAAGVGVLTLGLAGTGSAARVGGLSSLLGPGGAAVSANVGGGKRDIRGSGSDAKSLRLLLGGQFGLADGLDLRVALGGRDVEVGGFDGDMGLSLGAGLKYGLWNSPKDGLKFVLDGQVEYLGKSSDGPVDATYLGVQAAAYLLKEVGAAGRMGYLAGYGGVYVPYGWYDLDPGSKRRNKSPLGLFGGADYFVTPNVFFSGEVHMFDEYALHLGVGYRF